MAWTPTGDGLLFAGPEDPSRPDGDRHATLWIGSESGRRRFWTLAPSNALPREIVGLQWSPTGERLLAHLRTQENTGTTSEGTRLLSFELDGPGGEVVSAPTEVSPVGGSVSWSPDARRFVASVVDVTYDAMNNPVLGDSDLYLYDVETDAVAWPPVNTEASERAAAWSPVDDSIVFVRSRAPSPDIMTWRPGSNAPPTVLRPAPCDVVSLAWFPEGDRLLLRCTQDPSPIFAILDADGNDVVSPRDGYASDISPDGRRIFVEQDLPIAMTISVFDVDTFEMTEVAIGRSPVWRPHG